MRLRCLPGLLVAALTAAGCVHRPAPYPYYYAAPPQPTAPQVLQYPGEPAPPYHPVGPEVLQYPAEPPPQIAQAPYVIPAEPAQAVPVQGCPYGSELPYFLDSGDRLRIVVFGQQGLTNTYAVDAAGNIAMPLIGTVPARGATPPQLAKEIAARLRRGFVRDPSVTAEVVAYRPFFILGEVNNAGQYPYVAHMTVETAIAIAGGFAPRARKDRVKITRQTCGQVMTFAAPVTFKLKPGDTIRVKERWF